MSRKRNELRYIRTNVVNIPVCKIGSKRAAYIEATGPGWGTVEWYSAVNDYKAPVNRNRSDKTQQLICDEDNSAVLYPKYGAEFVIVPYEDINLKKAPTQAETAAIVCSNSSGFDFWEAEEGDVKFFVTYDEYGLIDMYRLGNWADKPTFDGEVEITFKDLISEEEGDTTDRADIPGTHEYFAREEKKRR